MPGPRWMMFMARAIIEPTSATFAVEWPNPSDCPSVAEIGIDFSSNGGTRSSCLGESIAGSKATWIDGFQFVWLKTAARMMLSSEILIN